MKKATKNTQKLCAAGLALALALGGGAAAFAENASGGPEAPTQASATIPAKDMAARGGMPGGKGFGMGVGMGAPDAAGLTEEQKQAMATAEAAYDAAEAEALAALVDEGALPQVAVAQYLARRQAQRSLESKDYSAWTVDQLSALRQAMGREGVNETVLAGLMSQGVLTQEEADAMRLAYGPQEDLWAQLDTSKATQGSLAKLTTAKTVYAEALAAAGLDQRPQRGHGPQVPDDQAGYRNGPKEKQEGRGGDALPGKRNENHK